MDPRQQGLHSNEVMEGEEDNRQEKTSVFQKAKAKARKVKDTIKMKTSHGPDQGHDEEEDEHMAVDSEVHDTVPKYESPAVQKKPDDKLGKPATAAEDQYGSKYTDPQTRPFSQWQDENTGSRGVDTARPTGTGAAGVKVPEKRDGSFSSSGTPASESAGNLAHGERGHVGLHPKISTETPDAMKEDPHARNDRPDVADPTGAGGEEAGIGSILNSFNKVNINDGKPQSKPISERAPERYTDSDDHFSPEAIPPISTINPDNPGSIPKSFDGDKPEDAPLDNVTKLPSNQSSYTDKISYATSAIAGTAIAAKNVVGSKLGYGSTEDPNASPKATQGGEEIGKPETTTVYEKVSNAGSSAKNVVASKLGYGSTEDPTAAPKATQGGEEIGKPRTTTAYEKVSNAGSSVVIPLYQKVSSVGSSVVSKARGTGTKQDQGVEGQDQGVPAKKGYLAEKLRPSDDDKALSEVISDTLHNRKQEVDGGEEKEGGNQKPAVGNVTESKEVRERLGSDEDNREMRETESKAAANESPRGKGMVESVKGTVTSWFSKGGDQKQNSEASPGTTKPEEERLPSSTGEAAAGYGQNRVGERRLQESGN